MKTKNSLVMIIAAVILLGGLSPAWSLSESEQRQLAALRKELKELQVDEVKMDAEGEAIEARKVTLLMTRDLINGSRGNIEKDQAALVRDAAKQEIVLTKFDAKLLPLHNQIRSYNLRCGDNYNLSQAEFNACKSEKTRLDNQYKPYDAEAKSISAWGLKINATQETITQRREAVEKQALSLNKDVLKWAARKNSYNGAARAQQAKEDAILKKIRALLLNDSFLDDLKARESIARSCARINDAMTATRCLDRIYHGSR